MPKPSIDFFIQGGLLIIQGHCGMEFQLPQSEEWKDKHEVEIYEGEKALVYLDGEKVGMPVPTTDSDKDTPGRRRILVQISKQKHVVVSCEMKVRYSPARHHTPIGSTGDQGVPYGEGQPPDDDPHGGFGSLETTTTHAVAKPSASALPAYPSAVHPPAQLPTLPELAELLANTRQLIMEEIKKDLDLRGLRYQAAGTEARPEPTVPPPPPAHPHRPRAQEATVNEQIHAVVGLLIDEVKAMEDSAEQKPEEPQLQEFHRSLLALEQALQPTESDAEKSAHRLVSDLLQRLDPHPPLARARQAHGNGAYRIAIESIINHLKMRREGQNVLTSRNLGGWLAGIVRELWKGGAEGGFARAREPLDRCLDVLNMSIYIPDLGSSRNPKLHQVVGRQQAVKGQGLNQVLRVVAPGIRLGEDILERAQVEISEAEA